MSTARDQLPREARPPAPEPAAVDNPAFPPQGKTAPPGRPSPGAAFDSAGIPMYLVDLGSGNETLFRSTSELGEAIRRGVVGDQCRIYHRARATWLPITVHPAYRQLAAEPTGSSGAAARRQWTFMPAEEAESAPAAQPPSAVPQEVMVMPPPARSWRQSLGSAFRFWDRGRH